MQNHLIHNQSNFICLTMFFGILTHPNMQIRVSACGGVCMFMCWCFCFCFCWLRLLLSFFLIDRHDDSPSCREVGVVRTMTTPDGNEIQEKLISRDDDDCRVVIALVSMKRNPGLVEAEITVAMKVSMN